MEISGNIGRIKISQIPDAGDSGLERFDNPPADENTIQQDREAEWHKEKLLKLMGILVKVDEWFDETAKYDEKAKGWAIEFINGMMKDRASGGKDNPQGLPDTGNVQSEERGTGNPF